jgi:ABC-type nitrate/sulfonate/bicarbonate transport system permease component
VKGAVDPYRGFRTGGGAGGAVASGSLGMIMFLALWQVLAMVVGKAILPSPVEVLPIFFSSLTGDLGLHLLASAGRVLSAMGLAVLTAVPAGLGLGQARRLNRIFSPLIAILYPIPKIVLLPVLYVLFGITDLSKIVFIAMIVFFQILVVVRDEAANLAPELIFSVRSLGAGRRALFRFVYFPASMPAVLTALRVSVGTAVAVLFIAEQSLTTYGLGYYIVVETYQVLRYPEMYAGIVAMGLLGLALYAGISLLELRFNRHLRPEEG